MLDGRKFHILSDHKPLTQALHRVSDPWTPLVQRQLSFLAELTTATVHTQVQPIQLPVKRFSHVHIDIVGPLPASPGGCMHLLTMVDRSTRWAEAVPLVNTSTANCAAAFSQQLGEKVWKTCCSVQFSSAVWGELCKTLGISHWLTTAYHPQVNGLVERFHRQLKDALRARLDNHDWTSHLPWVMLGRRAAPKEDCCISSAEMVYGEALTLPGDFLHHRLTVSCSRSVRG